MSTSKQDYIHHGWLRSRKNKNAEPGFWVTGASGKDTFWTPSLIKSRIMADDNAVKHALLRIYSFQTAGEQKSGHTHATNAIGFGGHDSKLLSSFAEQLKTKGFLSKKQLDISRKRISKYSRQLFGYIIDDLLKAVGPDIGHKNVWDLLRYNDYSDKLASMANHKEPKLVDWEKIRPFLRKEELHKYRGAIHGTDFGI